MPRERIRDILIGLGLLAAVAIAVWFVAGRESDGVAAKTPGRTIEREAVNKGEEATTKAMEADSEPPRPATSQESLLRDEVLRNSRETAMRRLKEGN